jgi:hypothetical protein
VKAEKASGQVDAVRILAVTPLGDLGRVLTQLVDRVIEGMHTMLPAFQVRILAVGLGSVFLHLDLHSSVG